MRDISRPDHATTEQLSALLDDRAEPGERWFLTGHLDECSACATEYDGLRSVRSLLRALPLHLPPRSFTIQAASEPPRRPFQRLIPLTRMLGAIAAALCVVLFSADAFQVGSTWPKQVHESTAALQITSTTRTDAPQAAAARSAAEAAAETAAKSADSPAAKPALVGKPAAPDAGRAREAAPAVAAPAPADAAVARSEYPPSAAAAPAPPPAPAAIAPAPAQSRPGIAAAPKAAGGEAAGAQPAAARPADSAQPAAAAAPPVAATPAQSAFAPPASTLEPQGTVAAFAATQPPLPPTRPPAETSVAVLAPPQAPTGTGSQIGPVGAVQVDPMPIRIAGIEVTPLRVAGTLLGVIAVVMLLGSLALSRRARQA